MKLTVLLIFTVLSCAPSTTIEQSWTPPGGPHPALHKVVTVMLWHNVTVRRSAEDQLAARLRHAGVNAVPGYTVLTDQDIQDPEQAREHLLATGFDGAIVMRFVGAHQEISYMPPTYYGYWGGAWWPDGGYMTADTIVKLETAAYSLPDKALIYSAVSRTVDPSSVSSLISAVTEKVAKVMRSNGTVIASLQTAPEGG